MPVILVVDDSQTDVLLITSILKDFETITAFDGMQALETIDSAIPVDLILLDLHMPRLDGFSVLAALQERQNEIPVIILTNLDEIDNEIRGLELGAVDYIRKPLNFLSLRKRIEVHLRLRNATWLVKEHNRLLEETVKRRTAEVVRTNEITINALVRLLEVRHIETSNHSRRTKWMMQALCDHLVAFHRPGYDLTEKVIEDLVNTAPLHDIGKVGVPDSILLKPGRLDPAEFEIMKSHVEHGVEALEYRMESTDAPISFIEMAKEIIQCHHEWYDGSGYPKGLAGQDIPLPGRLMAIIDVYDALTSRRVYKDAISHQQALAILKRETNSHFDPVVMEAFIQAQDEILEISHTYRVEAE
ncbi:MAG: two-component system response regulator [Spirochaetae bacterium HGW-Spirochaetae-8]|nr:MAG: two-component system response regulator [Spirochaetae bacterium HGW-Spirochaetae-8]